MPTVSRAFAVPRPLTTYYRAFQFNGDTLSNKLLMETAISVLAKIRLFYESPPKE